MNIVPGSPEYFDAEYMDRNAPKMRRLTQRWFRPEIQGVEHIPQGPFIGVGNHSGGVMMPDVFTWLSFYHSLGRPTRLMAFTNPALFRFYPKSIVASLARMGAVSGLVKTALRTLQQGHALQIYPGGDLDACRPFWRGNKIVFNNTRLYAKLAAKTGLPVLPVVSYGAHKALCILWDGAGLCRWLKLPQRINLQAFPLSLCLPWGAWFGPPPGYLPLPVKIRIKVLPPVWVQGDIEAADRNIQALMQQELDNMARGRGK